MEEHKKGISSRGLKLAVIFFTALWVTGRTLSRTALGGASGQALVQLLSTSPGMMYLAAGILVLEAAAACAVPLTAALVLEGTAHTSDFSRYVLRMAVLALVSEIPYDLVMTGKMWDLSGQNPIWALVLSQLMLWFFGHYVKKGLGAVLIGAAVAAAAGVWSRMLHIEYGMPILLSVLVLWFFRKTPGKWGFAGALAGALCVLLSPFFLAAPMSALFLHFYNGERGEYAAWIPYAAFPVLLVLGACMGAIL